MQSRAMCDNKRASLALAQLKAGGMIGGPTESCWLSADVPVLVASSLGLRILCACARLLGCPARSPVDWSGAGLQSNGLPPMEKGCAGGSRT